MWKSNTILNEIDAEFDLISQLEVGRYLFETKSKPVKFIYVYILSNDVIYRHQTIDSSDTTIQLSLKELVECGKPLRRVMYKTDDAQLPLKELANDFHLTSLRLSDEYFNSMLNRLKNSTESLCQSLKAANDQGFLFAII